MTGFERRQARRRLDLLRTLAANSRSQSGLFEQMAKMFPGCDDYPVQAAEFSARADAIDAEIAQLTEAHRVDD